MILQKNNKWSLDGHWQFSEKSHPEDFGKNPACLMQAGTLLFAQ